MDISKYLKLKYNPLWAWGAFTGTTHVAWDGNRMLYSDKRLYLVEGDVWTELQPAGDVDCIWLWVFLEWEKMVAYTKDVLYYHNWTSWASKTRAWHTISNVDMNWWAIAVVLSITVLLNYDTPTYRILYPSWWWCNVFYVKQYKWGAWRSDVRDNYVRDVDHGSINSSAMWSMCAYWDTIFFSEMWINYVGTWSTLEPPYTYVQTRSTHYYSGSILYDNTLNSPGLIPHEPFTSPYGDAPKFPFNDGRFYMVWTTIYVFENRITRYWTSTDLWETWTQHPMLDINWDSINIQTWVNWQYFLSIAKKDDFWGVISNANTNPWIFNWTYRELMAPPTNYSLQPKNISFLSDETQLKVIAGVTNTPWYLSNYIPGIKIRISRLLT